MKKLIVFVITVFLIFENGYAQKKEKNPVMPMGNGIYMVGVSGNGNGRLKSLGQLREIAFAKAKQFASKNNAKIEVISVNETPMSFGVFNQVDLSFRLVSKTEKLSDPNVNSTTIIKAASANGKTTSEQVIESKDNAKKDEEKYERLLRLGELRKKGIITEEEFQKEKNKILNN